MLQALECPEMFQMSQMSNNHIGHMRIGNKGKAEAPSKKSATDSCQLPFQRDCESQTSQSAARVEDPTIIHSAERIAKLNIPGIAESGTWSYKVVNTHSSPQTFTLLVTSRAIDECVPPVTVTGGMSETEGPPGGVAGGCSLNLRQESRPESQIGYASLSQTVGHIRRVLVYTWAILRWGVFSEFNSQEPFYVGKTGEAEAVSCPKNIRGTLKNPNGETDCEIDPSAGQPTNDCVFVPHIKQNTKVSIMYQPSIAQVSS
ncbi:CLCA1 regulator, partial [Atractosteus spatula]|nr:CLCA1 regulator [Atractosteus spatula]